MTMLQPESGHEEAVFVVTADRSPQLLCRLFGLIAQQDRCIEWIRADPVSSGLEVRFAVAELDSHRAAIVAEKARMMIGVRSVRLCETQRLSPQPEELLGREQTSVPCP
jgi:hypothetical protein